MIPIVLLLAFNWFVLFVVLYIGDSFWHHLMTPVLMGEVAGVALVIR